MGEVDTFGITLPVNDWCVLFDLAQRADRAPSDYLRKLIRAEACARGLLSTNQPNTTNEAQNDEAAPARS